MIGTGLERVPNPPLGLSARALATRITTPPVIDGVMDEPFWETLHRGGNIGLDDHIVIGLDTFNDRRNGYIF